MTRRRRIAAVAILAVAVLALAYALAANPEPGSVAAEVPTGTAEVSRGTVTERVQLPGVLGYQGSRVVIYPGSPGMLTSIAEPGTTLGRGDGVYTVASQPVRLLYGLIPAHRDFAAGMSDGPDVRQLEENLVAFGVGHLVTVDDHFSAATTAAVRRWQQTQGVPNAQRTGVLPLGRVVFLPGAVRISGLKADVGMGIGPNEPVLSVTSTNRVVTARVPADRQALIHLADQALVSITGAAPIPGKVTHVATVTDTSESGEATLAVTISVEMPTGGAALDQAPVQVAITSTTRHNVLLVPITALLARPGGGYQVRLASGEYVEVRPGLFDSQAGRVEVTGGLTTGQRVRVPTS